MEIQISCVILVGGSIDKKLLNKCVKSVSWCDEIIKINTSKIKGSFSEWRNEGIKKANGAWVFYVDTDEEISKELKDEIESKIINSNSLTNAYAIPRRNIIFSKEFKYSGQYPDYQIRLFKRSSFKKWSGNLHEQPEFNGKLEYLKKPIIHHKNITISQMIEKTNKWSEIESQLMIQANHPPMNIFRFVSAGCREFFKRFILEKSFMDGKEGIIYSTYQVYSKLISYAKLWEKQQSTIRI